ncbi:EamA family transporter [Putridiphycobacter roseus]|uniref:EamA family transporter n=1 Tax=Putridiphycobacter roseus TaxID=2219161 RepID=A0A2W1N243_9FLAO|nr:DMT family transporter [Putridiphycobacter roseus]PZE17021.1 EamA family transporter [Putridiphycobacter roseus]
MKNETKAWLILMILSLVWGSSFILIKKAMEPIEGVMVFKPFQVGGLRMLIAGMVLLPIALKSMRLLNKRNSFYLFLVGMTGNFLPSFLFPLAETKIQSSLAGLLNMGTSVFVIIIAWFFFKDRINKIQMIGFSLCVFGLSMILFRQVNEADNDFFYALYVVIATACYAISMTLIKHKLQHLKPKEITALAFFFMLPFAIALTYFSGGFAAINMEVHTLQALGYLFILSVIGTALAVLLFNQLVSISTPLFTSSVTYIIPVIALFFGVLDGESFNMVHLIWIVLIFLGVYFMGKKGKNDVKSQERKVN